MCRDRPAQGPGPTTYSWPMSGDDLDHARPNKLVAAIMSLFAAPRLNMQEDYQKVRRFQRLLAGPTGRYQVLDRVILADDESHEIPVRVLLPAERRHQDVLLFLHGGGWVTGDIESYTPACSALADATGRVVLSVDYRLAPEHPFPAGFDDCFRVAEVLLREPGLLDLDDASQITLIGDSAGGNLAAAVCLGLRDLGLPLPGRQVLLYPATWPDHDPQTSPFDSVRQFGTGLRLTALEVQDYMTLYEPSPEARVDPRIAPLLADDLSGQPTTLVVTAEFDLLRDEGEAYGQALVAAGNTVRIERIDGAYHGFLTLPRFAAPVVRLHGLINDFLGSAPEVAQR